ncbi:MAG: pyruvate kinase [Bacteroidia bacterium]|nr:MAG: pyruvate kinase [Bacteroidia bacterium]PIE86436.1 MAG: pyruvate kinase [Bacteroidia bacterium]
MKYEESKTKIIATVGPASSSKEMLKSLVIAGVDVFRLNFSHASHEEHLEIIKKIREINTELNFNTAILADLQGPKLRIGEVENNAIELVEGQEIVITNEKCIGTKDKIYLSYPEFAEDVSVGENILIDDGKLKLQVLSTNKKDSVKAKVVHGGILSSRKGVNLPNTRISLPSLTAKDIIDAQFALENGVDWLALSFVRSVTDIVELKQIVKRAKKSTFVLAKIEKPEALASLDEIIALSDGIMVARGDLGVEVDFFEVPLIQKMIVQKCIAAAKPVIIATQMMESMISNFLPTRAEATDVANAVVDGADALMLSGETSIGENPLEVIESMHKIIQWTEKKAYKYNRGIAPQNIAKDKLFDTICFSAARMAAQVKAKAIITFTFSGYTPFKISSFRPNAKIFVFTKNKKLVPKLSLIWGARTFDFDDHKSIEEAIEFSMKFLKEKGFVKTDDVVIHVGSTPLLKTGRTNMLKISRVE